MNKLDLPITGIDIMVEFEIPAGPEIGKMLQIIIDAQVENPQITKIEALELIRKTRVVYYILPSN